MHAHFFGHFLDHHRLQMVGAVIQEFALPLDDDLADPQDGVLALLDALHQLHRGGEAFLHVIANFAVGGIARQQAAIDRAQPQLRHVVVVHEHLPLVVHFAEIDVRLDQPRLRLVVAQAGARIELLDHVHGALHQFHRTVQRARNFLQLIGLHLLQVFGNNLLRQRVLRIERASCISRHSRRLRAATPSGSNSCTTARASSTSSSEYFPFCAISSSEALR